MAYQTLGLVSSANPGSDFQNAAVTFFTANGWTLIDTAGAGANITKIMRHAASNMVLAVNWGFVWVAEDYNLTTQVLVKPARLGNGQAYDASGYFLDQNPTITGLGSVTMSPVANSNMLFVTTADYFVIQIDTSALVWGKYTALSPAGQTAKGWIGILLTSGGTVSNYLAQWPGATGSGSAASVSSNGTDVGVFTPSVTKADVMTNRKVVGPLAALSPWTYPPSGSSSPLLGVWSDIKCVAVPSSLPLGDLVTAGTKTYFALPGNSFAALVERV